MKFNFIDIAPKILVINAALFLILYFIFLSFMEMENIISGYAFPIAAMSTINSVLSFLYPLAIVFTRTKKDSYAFLKSWWHYIAIILTIIYWVSLFN